MSALYTLIDGVVAMEHDLLIWGRWFETADRSVSNTEIGGVRVSTVFLGIDHRFDDDGPPILWETMIFGGEHDLYQKRYSNLAAAEAGHLDAVALVKNSIGVK